MTLVYNIINEPDEGSDCAKDIDMPLDIDVNDPIVNIWDNWIDPNVESVSNLLKSRMEVGFKKYGTTTERTDIDLLGWLQHLQEELLDAAVYIERLKKEVNNESK